MTKITVTINDVKYEFDSMEEAQKAFPAYIDIEKDMNDIFDETDMVFSAMDDVFDRVDDLFKKLRKVKIQKSKKPNIKVPPQKPKKKETCGCICECNRPVEDNDKLCKVCQGKPNKRVDIKGLLKDPIKKAKLIADAVRAARFFK